MSRAPPRDFPVIAIMVMLLIGLVANAQLNVKKADGPKTLTTLMPYCSYLKQDDCGYHLVTKSYNKYDEMDYWIKLGDNKTECLASLKDLTDILGGDTDAIYTIQDSMGEDIILFVVKGLFEKTIGVKDSGHRYAGNGQIDVLTLNKAKKWVEENL